VVFWRPSSQNPGLNDYVCRWPQFSPVDTATADGWYYALPWDHDDGRADPYLKLETIDYGELLERHTPRLLYDGDEDFHALSPAAATDFFDDSDSPDDPEDSNQLEDAGGVFATANPMVSFGVQDDLDLEYLDSVYRASGVSRRAGTSSHSGDFISLRGNGQGPGGIGFSSDGYDADAAQMEARPGYSNRAYGRVAHGGDGKLWLQYWIYYYFDSQGDFGGGVHEGDWEMIQVGLDGQLQPDTAAYSQHGTGERCAWSEVESDQGRPRVYVAQGSHASYIRPGHYDDPDPDDDANGDGLDATPVLEEITGDTPSWVAWPGRWGDSQEEAFSPPGPRFQSGEKWSDPTAWADALAPCDAS